MRVNPYQSPQEHSQVSQAPRDPWEVQWGLFESFTTGFLGVLLLAALIHSQSENAQAWQESPLLWIIIFGWLATMLLGFVCLLRIFVQLMRRRFASVVLAAFGCFACFVTMLAVWSIDPSAFIR
jgi:hypothetical protein